MKRKKRKGRILRFLLLLLLVSGLLIWGIISVRSKNKAEKMDAEASVEPEITEEAAPDPTQKPTEAPTPEITVEPTVEPEPAVPEKTPEELLEERVQEKLATMTTEEKVAQLFIVTPEALTGVSEVQNAGEVTRERFNQIPVGGMIYFEQNIQNPEQTREMLAGIQKISQDRIGLPAFTSVDEEGGTVTRVAGKAGFGIVDVGDMSAIGASGDPEQAYEVGKTMGAYLKNLGFNLDFAPCADVLTNPQNKVVKLRSFGSNPVLVTEMVCRQMDGLEEAGVLACPKHFPGHGATEGDTHAGYSYTGKTLEELKNQELVPFAAAIARGSDFLMVGHISLPNVFTEDLPASLSYEAITGLLREDMGYQGLVITDALNMGAIQNTYGSAQAAVMAFQAGSDLLLMPEDFASAYAGVLDAVQLGEISQERLDASVARILRVKFKL